MGEIRSLRSPSPDRQLVNYEIEMALLGGLMARNDAWFEVSQICRAEHFADALHGRIFTAAGRLITAGGRADFLTLKAEFERDPAIQQQGGKNYLLRLANSIVTVINLPDYADAIRDLWLRRQITERAEALRAQLDDFEARPDEIIARIVADLQRLSGEGRETGVSARTIAERLVEMMQRPAAVCSTGIHALDEAMAGGLYAGKLYGLSGRKKAGKSALLGTISYNLEREQVRHLFCSFEMAPIEIEQRNAARHLAINAMAYLRRPTKDLASRTAEYACSLSEARVYEHAPGATLDELRNMIGRGIVRQKVAGVIVDYWQLVGGKQRNETEEYHLRNVADTLASMGRRHGIWILVGCQLNQEGNTRGGEGLRLACDMLLALNRSPGSETAWLEMQESRYTPYRDVGSELVPGLWMYKNGPYFSDVAPPTDHSTDEKR
jgi:replicative DNA helicase